MACIRIAVPYTGMILSTRESEGLQGAGAAPGYFPDFRRLQNQRGRLRGQPEPAEECSEQFDVSDQRTLDEVVNWLMGMGYIPSFCTACYREGRTGDRFMSLCKSGQIQNCCLPNALMTLKGVSDGLRLPGYERLRGWP